MVKVFAGTPAEYMLDGYVLTTLDTAKRVIVKDWDMIFAVDGPEGSGKSLAAQQFAYYCDPTLTLDRITFTPSEFRRAVTTTQPFASVIYDEAYTGLSARASMSIINRTLVSMLAEIRQKNLFIFVVMPTFFDLDRYVALWRTRGLFHIYTGDDFERGYVAFYNVDRKKDLYIQGKKFYSYANPRPNFIARFVDHYTVDKVAYKAKKLASLSGREAKAEEAEMERRVQERMFTMLQEAECDLTHSDRIAILKMPSATYYRRLSQYNTGRELS
jgi:hypothetical protein